MGSWTVFGTQESRGSRAEGSRVQEAGKVAVEALVAGDELVGEGEAVHEAALLEPEDAAEAAAEEDALHAGPRHQPLRKARLAASSPILQTSGSRNTADWLSSCNWPAPAPMGVSHAGLASVLLSMCKHMRTTMSGSATCSWEVSLSWRCTGIF